MHFYLGTHEPKIAAQRDLAEKATMAAGYEKLRLANRLWKRMSRNQRAEADRIFRRLDDADRTAARLAKQPLDL